MTPNEAIQHAAAEFIRDRRPLEGFVYGLPRNASAAEDMLREVWVRLGTEVGKSGAAQRGIRERAVRMFTTLT